MDSVKRFLENIPVVTRNLLLVNVFIFIVMALTGSRGEALIDKYLALHYVTSPNFNPAQIFTYMFLHGGFVHIFFNMFALYVFGPNIERALGSRRFLFYYISCGIGAALIQEGVYALMLMKYNSMFTPEQMSRIVNEGCAALSRGYNFSDEPMSTINLLVNIPVVGASGAIYGVLLAFGMLWPNATLMLLIPPMPVKAKWLVTAYAVIELLLGLSGRGDGIAHFCHLGGMLVGLIIILYWKNKFRSNGY